MKTSTIVRFAKHYPLSCLSAVGIWVLCLVPYFPETPLDDVSMVDKWTHIVLYAVLCVIVWAEYLRRHRTPNYHRLLWGAVVAPAAMGGLIELAQAYLTFGHRSGEWLDFAADGVGVLVGAAIGMLLARCRAKA